MLCGSVHAGTVATSVHTLDSVAGRGTCGSIDAGGTCSGSGGVDAVGGATTLQASDAIPVDTEIRAAGVGGNAVETVGGCGGVNAVKRASALQAIDAVAIYTHRVAAVARGDAVDAELWRGSIDTCAAATRTDRTLDSVPGRGRRASENACAASGGGVHAFNAVAAGRCRCAAHTDRESRGIRRRARHAEDRGRGGKDSVHRLVSGKGFGHAQA